MSDFQNSGNVCCLVANKENIDHMCSHTRGVGTGRVGRAMALPIICLKLVFPIDNNTNDSQWPYQ